MKNKWPFLTEHQKLWQKLFSLHGFVDMEYRLKSSPTEKKNSGTKSGSSCTKLMKLMPEARSQFPTFYFQEKSANRTINKYHKQIFELTKIYFAPLMFSYNTSFNWKFETSPQFVIFGQHARQPASIQSWKLGEEASRRISGSRKVSNFAGKTPGGVAKCRSSTANEFQDL
jgi:hypothetical protein